VRQALPTQEQSRRFGELLLAKGLISEDELKVALVEQRRTQHKLGEILEYMGFIGHEALRDAVGESFGYLTIQLSHIIPDREALALVNESLARLHALMPIAYDKSQRILKLATCNPDDLMVMDRVRRQLPFSDIQIHPYVASEKEIMAAVDHYYGYELSVDGILSELETGEISVQGVIQSDAYAHPIVRLLDSLLVDSVKQGASDIHVEPEAHFVRIRYRLDGVLRQIRLLHISVWPALLVRIKIVAGLDISETRLPQDGHIHLLVAGREVDFRVASHPVMQGENVVLRVLDREKGIVPLPDLGINAAALKLIHRMMSRPVGVILMTGPTGSGKTTTLYAMIHQINQMGLNIMTLEDPVEYPMPLVRQTTVHEDIGMTFSVGVRSIMRQDPDVILLGEIRDQDTASMAMRASMTGHQVYATLHANDCFGAIPRLRDIGVDAFTLAGNINGILSQRLVRKLCRHCCYAVPASDVQQQTMLIGVVEDRERFKLSFAEGCDACGHTGFKGRVAIVEAVVFDADFDELVAQGASIKQMRQLAKRKGFMTLAEVAVEMVLQGITSLDEVMRVVDLSSIDVER
jgi:type II secretory ATPase GspE/PulE/Tfp pilus assembly ATPase PilB-like protein